MVMSTLRSGNVGSRRHHEHYYALQDIKRGCVPSRVAIQFTVYKTFALAP